MNRRTFLGTSTSIITSMPACVVAITDPPPPTSANLKAADFGVKGDGTTDNSAALIRLRDHMTANRALDYRVAFTPGNYRYTNNRWLRGVGSVTIDAQGATFTNTLSTGSERLGRPFDSGSIWMNDTDQPWPTGVTSNSGSRIQAAAKGDIAVRLVASSDAAKFPVGVRVMIHSFDHQFGGYPPNMRFFEWRTVVAVDAAAGRISLNAPLDAAHRTDIPDRIDVESGGLGLPRIMSLERAGFYYPKRIEIIGATFGRNPNAGEAGLILPADTLIMRGVTWNGWLWPSENRLATYEDCVLRQVEIDKEVGRCELRRCRCSSAVLGATGCNDLLIEGCDVTGYIGVTARRTKVSGGKVRASNSNPWGAVRSYYDWSFTNLLEVDGLAVEHDGSLAWAVNPGAPENPVRLTAAGRGPNNEILVADDQTARSTIIPSLAVDTCLKLANASDMGGVTAIAHDGTQWVIKGAWTVTVQAGQVWEFCNIQKVAARNITFVGSAKPVLRDLHPTQVRIP